MPESNSPDYVEVPVVIVQVCVPSRSVAFENQEIDLTGIPKAKTLVEIREANGIRGHRLEKATAAPIEEDLRSTDIVRRWMPGRAENDISRYSLPFGQVLDRDGHKSASAEHISLIGSTERGQPVFEQQGRRPQDYIALEASIEAVNGVWRDLVKYWFRLPAEIPSSQFTEWQEPISREDNETRGKQRNPTFWNLTHGQPMDIYPIGENALKMRFKRMRIRDYYDENRFWYRSRKALAEKYYRGVTGEARSKLHFVPARRATIPPC